MPGSFVRDAFEPTLETGLVVNAAGTDSGSIIDCMHPREVRIELKTGTVTSTTNSATLSVEIRASNSSTFATSVSLGRFAALSGTDAAQSNVTRYLTAYTNYRYLRATAVTGGTAPDYGTTTVRVLPEHNRQADTDSA